jgi:branched-chain amino acid transport system permease protein
MQTVSSQSLAVPLPTEAAARRLDLDLGLCVVLVAALILALPLANATGNSFWADLLNRVMILAIAATSLNLLVGIGGLVSLGHAAFLGIGAYTVGICAELGLTAGGAQLAIALAVATLFALVTGMVALRTRGVHFIMITLAFGQMLYFVMIGLRQFGGDDGLTVNEGSQFPAPFTLENRTVLYYTVLAVLALTLFGFARLHRSRFGLVLLGAKGSERRVAASGFDPFRYQLVAYVIAGAVCAVAGCLSANHTSFVTPEIMGWTRSAELIFIVILGGTGTLSGPLLGAILFLLIEELLGSMTIYWHFPFGLLLVLVALFARGGIVGLLTRRGQP